MKQRMIAQFTDDCGCSTTGGGEKYELTFSRCKLHASAPALLEALEEIEGCAEEAPAWDDEIKADIAKLARDAIEAAKGDA